MKKLIALSLLSLAAVSLRLQAMDIASEREFAYESSEEKPEWWSKEAYGSFAPKKARISGEAIEMGKELPPMEEEAARAKKTEIEDSIRRVPGLVDYFKLQLFGQLQTSSLRII